VEQRIINGLARELARLPKPRKTKETR